MVDSRSASSVARFIARCLEIVLWEGAKQEAAMVCMTSFPFSVSDIGRLVGRNEWI